MVSLIQGCQQFLARTPDDITPVRPLEGGQAHAKGQPSLYTIFQIAGDKAGYEGVAGAKRIDGLYGGRRLPVEMSIPQGGPTHPHLRWGR
jgi:hypothetical protein